MSWTAALTLCAAMLVVIVACDNADSKPRPTPIVEVSAGKTVAWSFDTHTGGFSWPKIVGGIAYVAGDGGSALYALDAMTGQTRWKFEPKQQDPSTAGYLSDFPLSHSIEIAGGTLYMMTLHGALYALDATTGQEKWKVPADPFSNLLVVGQMVSYLLPDQSITVADASGKSKWQFRPSVEGGDLYLVAGYASLFVKSAGTLYALDSNTGEVRWKKEGVGPVTSSALDRLVYMVNQGSIYALEEMTGREKWKTELTGQTIEGISSTDGMLCAAAAKTLICLDRNTGQELWHFQSSADLDGVVSQAGDLLFLVTTTKYITSTPEGITPSPAVTGESLYALDSRTGQEKWKFEASGSLGLPTIGDGVIYVGLYAPSDDQQTLYALDINTGQERWRFSADRRIRIYEEQNGLVYIAPENGYLYAIR